MAAQKFKASLVTLFAFGCIANADEVVLVKNQLSSCTKISNPKIVKDAPVPLLSFNVELKNSIGDCGCKSALGMFTVSARRESYNSYLLSGRVDLKNSGDKIIPIAADYALIDKADLDVSFSCAQPD